MGSMIEPWLKSRASPIVYSPCTAMVSKRQRRMAARSAAWRSAAAWAAAM
jgi:hypothetical protein